MVRERDKKLADANAEARAATAGTKGIEKRVTTFKGTAAKDATDDASGGGAISASPMAPNEEQLARINQYTRTPKTAAELVVFETLSCNDLFDRDDERFTTDTVKGFAKLPEPLGPVGKAYMVSHDYSKLPVGRIFGAGTKSVTVDEATGDKALFLTNEVYIPNTDTNKALIEGIDFGINWAVSVGVMLEASKCSLSFCDGDMMGFGRWAWCSNGHDKGEFYTADAEKDNWGYYIPCDAGVKGAEKCRTDMVGAKDFFELSQCFLGAQFYAALDGEKSVTARNIIKAASARHIPIIGLSAKEATDILSGVGVDPRVHDAIKRFGAKPDDEGTIKWTDDNNLVWTFDSDSGVLCLGTSSDNIRKEGDDGEGQSASGQPDDGTQRAGEGEQQPNGSDPVADAGLGADAEDGRTGTVDDAEVGREDGSVGKDAGHSHAHTHADGTSHNHVHTHSGGNGYDHTTSDSVSHTHAHDTGGSTNDTDADGKEAAVSKKAVLAALRSLHAPDTVLREVEGSTGDGLDTVLLPIVHRMTELETSVKAMTPKAALGEQFITAKRTDAIKWFVRANQQDNKGVDTTQFERMLDAYGDNVELFDLMIEQQKMLAQAKFPDATRIRRSTLPENPNEPEAPKVPAISAGDGDVAERSGKVVSRIHG
jgi:hypothetical protein